MSAQSSEALERKRAYRRTYYLKNREREISKSIAYHKTNRDRWMFTRREHRRKLRSAVIEHLGGKCSRCGFSDPRALQVDHVAGNGREDRAKFSNGATPAYLRNILADTTGKYQLLCANCNILKYWQEESSISVKTPVSSKRNLP